MSVKHETKPESTLDDKPWYVKVFVWFLTLLICAAIAVAAYGIFMVIALR